MKIVLNIVGVLAVLMGLLWIGQGTGLVMWPQSSFMLDQRIWAMWGVLLATAGVGCLLIARRR
jgi:hypothetical protein